MAGSILVLSEQSIVAALVAGLLELEDCRPVFAAREEGPTSALRRLLPLGAVLVDCEAGAAESDLFFTTASQHGIRVVVFGWSERANRIARIASRRGASWLTLPLDPERLRTALGSRRKETSRRRNPEMITAGDGTRILLDAIGRRWMIYDRRIGDRRTSETGAVDRTFVAEDGETRHYEMTRGAAGASSAGDLDAQLQAALP